MAQLISLSLYTNICTLMPIPGVNIRPSAQQLFDPGHISILGGDQKLIVNR